MTTVDTSIPLSIRPAQFDLSRVESPMNQMAAMYQLQGAQQANALRQMQMAAAEREIESTNALNSAYQSGLTEDGTIDYGKVMQSLARGGQGAQVPGVQKAMREDEKLRHERIKAQNEAITARLALARDALDRIDPKSPAAAQQYLAWHNANHADPVLGPYLKTIGADKDNAFMQISQAIQSGKLGDMIEQSKIGVTKFTEAHAPKPTTMNLHNRTVVIDSNPLSPTFKSELSTFTHGRTEHELATESHQGRTLDETIRHHKQLERVANERLQAEMQPGMSLTPETLDMVANVYIQTGTLPPLGIGKKAAEVKQQILNRASSLMAQQQRGDAPAAPAAGGAGAAPAAAPTAAAAPAFDAAGAAGTLVGNKQDTAARGNAVKNFSSGVEARSVRSFSTAIDHLETMDKLADALQNNDARAFNAVGNFFGKQTGNAAPTNFDMAKSVVGGEVAKALTGTNMALADREEIRSQLSAASSPEQLKGVITTLKALLGGQLKSLNQQYESGTGRKDFNTKLTPAARKELEKVMQPEAGAKKPPAVGTIVDGWRFKGGDPANKANWEKK